MSHQNALVSPSKVEEPAGHIWVIFILAVVFCGSVFAITLQAALAALVQVRGHADTGAILEEGLTGLLQAAHLALILQHRLANWEIEGCVNSIAIEASEVIHLG